MRTYHLQREATPPLLSVREVPNRDIGFYGSLNSRCDSKKGFHFFVGERSAAVGGDVEVKKRRVCRVWTYPFLCVTQRKNVKHHVKRQLIM